MKTSVCRTSYSLTPAAVGALALMIAAPAQAHGFGPRYELPLPLAVYLASAALAVFVSFVAMACFSRTSRGVGEAPRFDLLRTAPGRALASPAVIFVVRLAGVAVFMLIVAAGLLGTQSPLKNIAPAFVWALWWSA